MDPYKKIGIHLLNKRAELMKSNEKFSQDICNILKEAAEEYVLARANGSDKNTDVIIAKSKLKTALFGYIG